MPQVFADHTFRTTRVNTPEQVKHKSCLTPYLEIRHHDGTQPQTLTPTLNGGARSLLPVKQLLVRVFFSPAQLYLRHHRFAAPVRPKRHSCKHFLVKVIRLTLTSRPVRVHRGARWREAIGIFIWRMAPSHPFWSRLLFIVFSRCVFPTLLPNTR